MKQEGWWIDPKARNVDEGRLSKRSDPAFEEELGNEVVKGMTLKMVYS